MQGKHGRVSDTGNHLVLAEMREVADSHAAEISRGFELVTARLRILPHRHSRKRKASCYVQGSVFAWRPPRDRLRRLLPEGGCNGAVAMLARGMFDSD